MSYSSRFDKFDKLDNLIHKIFKFVFNYDKNRIKSLINKTIDNINLLENTLTQISVIILKYFRQLELKRDENRQDFIVSKILSFIESFKPTILNNNLKVADIGGGNGNVLSNINKALKGDKSNFICVESKDWIETYKYDNQNVTYVFWDNNTIDILDESCDVVLCMVSLHHMSNYTLANTLKELHRILKKNGLLMIKEHDCNSNQTCNMIFWEHHLYHLLDCAYDNRSFNYERYYNTNIYNFKSKEDWQLLIETNNLKYKCSKNRFLDGEYIMNDPKNASNLYWDIYTK